MRIRLVPQRFIADAEGMSKKKQVPRQRCTICRKWYRPGLRAVHEQKTCSLTCRRQRRRRLSRRRRELELARSREEERHRQQACRARRRETGVEGVVARVGNGTVSRAGLMPQVAELKEDILEIWDRALDVSRAGLQRELVRILGDTGGIWDKVGQKRGDVTNRLDSVSG